MGTATVQRTASDWTCTAANKKDSVQLSGCVPDNTQWGYAVKGPVYASDTGPSVELTGLPSSEPGLGKSVAFSGQAVVRRLVPGRGYKLHKLESVASVPTSPTFTLTGTPLHTFVASAAVQTFSVTLMSNSTTYFICVAA